MAAPPVARLAALYEGLKALDPQHVTFGALDEQVQCVCSFLWVRVVGSHCRAAVPSGHLAT